jgi:hypothetical protein
MLQTVRYGLPGLLIVAGFVILATAGGASRWEGWAMCVGAGLSVLLLNLLFRLGVEGGGPPLQARCRRDVLAPQVHPRPALWPGCGEDQAPHQRWADQRHLLRHEAADREAEQIDLVRSSAPTNAISGGTRSARRPRR